ncbi:MAG: hypothetical protein WBF15_10000 [Candidatus Sulfotelmatobacter sp.]
MPKFLMVLESAKCGHKAPGKVEGNVYSGPASVKVSCSECGAPATIETFQSVDRLPMIFGDHKSFYEVTIEEGKMSLLLRPNSPIFKEAMNVDWPEELDGKTGKQILPRVEEAVADLEKRSKYYRGMNERDWFGYDAVLGFLKGIIPTAKANPNVFVQLRLEISSPITAPIGKNRAL